MIDINRFNNTKKARVGLYSAGLQAYWSQFDGIRERLEGYGEFIERKTSQYGEVFNFGIVDNAVDARRAGEWFNNNNVDIIFCHSATYFTSSLILPIHQICKAPVVILNLQPTAQMNYLKTATSEWLAHCGGCAVPEFCNALNRAGISYKTVNGLLGQDHTPGISVSDENTASRKEAVRAWQEIVEWVKAAGVKRTLQHSRFGFLGNYYSGMLDMYSDFTLLQSDYGLHVELIEMCDLDRNLKQVTPQEIKEKLDEINAFFQVSGDSPSDPLAKKPEPEQLEWSAKVYAAQERMVQEYGLDSISYYYHGNDGNHYEQIQSGFIVGHSMLTARGVACAGEGDIKTAVAMKICDILDTGGSFCEIVANDYDVGSIIMGHDGPFHIKISADKPVLRGMGVYHGKKGAGVSVEAHVQPGDVTLLGVTQIAGGKTRMIISEGCAVDKPILMVGNTQTHVVFEDDPDTYMSKWFEYAPTHHFAMSVGKNASLFSKVAYLLDIEHVVF